MASATKKAWKLQEFVAHSSNVNCLALGQKSGRVMVTGGEDKKVNMWQVGKPNCIMSLSGHTSPVEAVRFGLNEDLVAAGSLSGGLKIWDLQAAKILRTLTGHKASIKCLDFYPLGNLIGSGSSDTNIKLWDVRKKACIYTYKGHTNAVNSIRFSPDGRWVASAGEDSLVKIWDLQAGKLLTEFKQHTGPVTSLEFHPNDLLLATASSDRTVKVWELQSFQLVSSTDGDCGPIRCIFFHPEGHCLYAGAADLMKVYGWEPSWTFDSIAVPWGRVADIAIAQNQLIGANFSQTNVSTYVVDIQRLHPIGGDPGNVASPPKSASGRRSFAAKERPATQSSRQQSDPKTEPEESSSTPTDDQEDDMNSSTDITSPEDYNQIFRPTRQIDRSPSRPADPFPAPPEDAREPPAEPAAPQKRATPPINPNATYAKPRTAEPVPAPVTKAAEPEQPKAQPKQNAKVPSAKEQPVGLDVNEFLPQTRGPEIPIGDDTSPEMSESEALSLMNRGHDPIMAVMSARHKNLQIVRTMWTGGNIKTAVDQALSMNELSIIVDLLNILNQKQSLWNLDLCAALTPKLAQLLNSKYDNYVQCACHAIRVILKNFGPVIKNGAESAPSIGVDISGEERHRKCKQCYGYLTNLRHDIEGKQGARGKLAGLFRELSILYTQLD